MLLVPPGRMGSQYASKRRLHFVRETPSHPDHLPDLGFR